MQLLSAEPANLRKIAGDLPLKGWKTATWRQGSKGAQRGLFTSVRRWAANGWRQGPQSSRVEEVARIEWPAGEPAPTRYWLARPGRRTSLRRLVATAKARGRIEPDYRELEDELGLDHFEGRSWMGWQHHVALVTTAFAFLRAEQRRRIPRGTQKKAAAAQPAPGHKTAASRPGAALRPRSLVPHPLRPGAWDLTGYY